MNNLIERYVHQVGRYLPRKERAEIEAELRSQIHDQLDDRYEGSPSPAEVAATLAELGHPRDMAASYGSQQYLVGPKLYPFMMTVMRHGWLIVPMIAVFLHVFGVLTSSQDYTLSSLLLEPFFAALQATLIFSGGVVLLFAMIQHSGINVRETFDPLALPEVDDPGAVDRFEIIIGFVIGVFANLAFLYWLRVGGLTLRFDLNNPGEVIPVPGLWLLLLIGVGISTIIINLVALRQKRWSAGLWLVETVLEVFGTICLYFVIYDPIFERIVATNPALGGLPLSEIIAILSAVGTLVSRGFTLIRLWNFGSRETEV